MGKEKEKSKTKKESNLPFQRGNYLIMLVGLSCLILGFTIMSLDNQPHGFGFLGITLGPIIVMIGFIIEFFAIMYNPKNNQ